MHIVPELGGNPKLLAFYHAALQNLIENLSYKAFIRFFNWARRDSNPGPRDYESPALPLSYEPLNLD